MNRIQLRNRWVWSLAFGAFIIACWHFLVVAFNMPSYIMPTPYAVAKAFLNGLSYGTYGPHLLATLQAMLSGYAAGAAAGIVIGGLLAEFRPVERVVFPYIVSIQSIPKIALAPLFVTWFGYGLSSKVVMVALICFFPMLVNTMTGLVAAEKDRLDIVKTMTASRWQLFWHVKLPSAVGPIFAGLQVSVVLALIGALVGEFVGSDAGLGNLIQASQATLDTAGMFAVLAILAAIGITFTAVVRFLHRRIVFWDTVSGAAAEA